MRPDYRLPTTDYETSTLSIRFTADSLLLYYLILLATYPVSFIFDIHTVDFKPGIILPGMPP